MRTSIKHLIVLQTVLVLSGVALAGCGPYTPATLPESLQDPAILSFWLDAGQGVTLDTNGRVESWQDQSGNGYIFERGPTNEQRRPFYVEDGFNGLPVLSFAGENDLGVVYDNDAPYELAYDQATVFVVAQNSGNTQGNLLGGCVDESTNNQFRYQPSGADFLWYAEEGWGRRDLQVEDTRSIQVISASFDAVGHEFYQNGAMTASSDLPSSGRWYVSQVGAWCSSEFLEGEIAEVLVYNVRLSDLERSQVEQYLLDKYSISTF